ncbi:MAG: hypothetical protein WD071_10125 [Pseudohongiella sp.]|uniref:hypothetical protein n=1 Tax=Pseudohongiella sp. TaxID=1979412 RepID=UPI0034A018CD
MSHHHRMLSNACAIAALFCVFHAEAQPFSSGGILENPGSAVARAAVGKHQINGFVPDRGAFRFPAPYNTQGFRLTNASDCNGNDCVNYTGYSYWRNMNNHIGKESMLIFLGLDRHRGGRGPSLYELNKTTGNLVDLGALFPESHRLSWASGEGWYFSATMPTKLYLNDGPKLVRFDVITEQMQTVFDVTNQLGAGYHVFQVHSSDNDRVHSATVRDNKNYDVQGCMAYDENTGRYHVFPVTREFDECQIDRSGEFLIIKANIDGKKGEDNLIVTLRTGEQRLLLDEDGAGGHSDVGHGYMIAADNWDKKANSWKMWDLTQSRLQGKPVYSNNDWKNFAPAHLSHTNARADLPGRQQYACGSSVNRGKGVHANEVVCVTLDGSGASVVVAPTMTNLDAPGGRNEYARFSKGNLDVTGKYFLWTSNLDGGRLDVFVVRVPDQLLTGITDHGDNDYDETDYDDNDDNDSSPGNWQQPVQPVKVEQPTVTPGAVTWQPSGNLHTSGGTVVKTGGCSGCPDVGMVSTQAATPDFGKLEFTVDSTWEMMGAGFTRSQSIPDASAAEFGLWFQSGLAVVREYGGYRADTPYNRGDRFAVLINNGKVEYTRNGVVFYTSYGRATHNLYSALTFFHKGATMSNVLFSVNRPGSTNPNLVGPSQPADNGAKKPATGVDWGRVLNVRVDGGWLVKSAGCQGCPDSGAISAKIAAGGSARMTFTADSTDPLLFAGFTRSQSIPDASSLDFGLRLQNGIAEVREYGAHRADTSFRSGDSFSIAVRNGKIEYSRNGAVFYTSSNRSTQPLYSGVSFFGLGAALRDVEFETD